MAVKVTGTVVISDSRNLENVAREYANNIVINELVSVTPSANLHVNGTSNIRSTAIFGGNVGIGITTPTSNLHVIGTANVTNNLVVSANTLFVDSQNIRVGIGTTAPTYKLEVNGSFAAQTKSFVINHPSKPDMKLQYASLEGPENGVYVRGECKGTEIELPYYWKDLVDENSITVDLTPIGKAQSLYVKKIENNVVHIASKSKTPPHCYYVIYGERKDVVKLIVEY